MFDNSGQDEEVRTSGDNLQVSALLGFAALFLPDVGEATAARGTVDTNVEAIERSYYGDRSDTLINGAPVAAQANRTPPPPRLRAKDLIAELDLINGQIHRIMFQVDRAVARLGTNA
jgi:hypothetical protein